MDTYKNWTPTSFDPRGHGLPGRQDWLVAPVMRIRDSGCRAESNFAVLLAALGGESDTVEVHRFGHWGPGWFEIILIDPLDTARVKEAEDAESALACYPVLDDMDLSTRESERAHDAWMHMRLKDRIYVCQRFRVSIFAARHDEVPDCSEIEDYLANGG